MEETIRQQAGKCIRIVLFGPESTGKTTLASALAAYYKTEWVPEFMRSYLQEKWDNHKKLVSREDLIPIAAGQMQIENEKAASAKTFLFCDTNLRELKVYSRYYYDGFCPPEILRACDEIHYDYYFLTGVDAPWQADDLRDRPHDRPNMFRIFEEELQQHKLPYTVLEGTLEERLVKANQVIATLKN
ncbi:MAG: ATP-binding protein [Bacteroidetes bacterium]|nr:ATP-binding protein [Bacteroidota bacterium]